MMIRTLSRPGISPSQVWAASRTAAATAGRRAHDGDAVVADPAQDLGAVDLAQHHLRDAQTGHRERHPPPVGVEHRQRVEVDVPVGDGRVHREGDGVDPDVAVGDLHALGPGGRAGGVVDAGRRALVGLPRAGLDALRGEHVAVVADHEAVLRGDAGQGLVELGVDVQDAGAGVLDDVGHLVGAEPEVDRHEHASRAGHAEERRQQSGGVVRDHRDAVADLEAELVEPGRLPTGQRRQLGVREVAQRGRRLVRLVDHADPVAVDGPGAVDEVRDAERDEHGTPHGRTGRRCTLVATVARVTRASRGIVRRKRRTAAPARRVAA